MTFNDMLRIAFNIVYHFGDIYNYSWYLSYLLDPTVLLDDNGFKNVGEVVGGIFYYTFYYINDYPYPDVPIVYPQD